MAVTRKEADDWIVHEIVRRLTLAYAPLKIYLFGSRARGTANPNSDYDILVIVDDRTAPELQTPTKGYQALWGMKVPIDLVVWTREAFDERLHISNSLPAEVVREGVILHGNS